MTILAPSARNALLGRGKPSPSLLVQNRFKRLEAQLDARRFNHGQVSVTFPPRAGIPQAKFTPRFGYL